MENSVEYLIQLAIILFAAALGTIVSKKLNQPPVLGQILMGIVLGMGIIEKTEFLEILSQLGVIFLMFVAGLETDINELAKSGKSSFVIAITGVIFTSVFAGGSVYLFTGNFLMSIVMGIAATATSISLSVQTMREIGQLRTKQGTTIIGAAIIDDIIGILLVTLVFGLLGPSDTHGEGVFSIIGKIALFFVIATTSGFFLTKILKKFGQFFSIDDKIVTFALVICFVMAFLAQEMGVAAMIGAYFAGVVFSMTEHRFTLAHDINKMASMLFVPIFFVLIGVGVELSEIPHAAILGIIYMLFSALGKIIGAGVIGARISGFDSKQALQIGAGMLPRAEVSLIIASLGVHMGVLGNREVSAVILMVIFTTLLTPSVLKWSFNR
jgi:Kef-type K+ transport system membrane component KefB